jgi:3-methylfumaryl-CoA hydratase
MTELDVGHLRSWIGKQETLHDQVTRFPVAALAATLDRDDPPPRAGDVLPPLWHWLYFLPTARQSILGPDGHPARGGFLPPVPLPRRMWAGGRFTFHQPLRVEEAITRVSTVQDVTVKQGRNGALCFVLVRHEVSGANGLALVEEHDIVYRDAPAPGEKPAEPKPVRQDGVWQRDIHPSDPLLFRYSALTFNSHRIHYDRRYVTETEGYPGLIVHGPLIATLLIDLLRRNTNRPVASFRFRAVSPLFDTAPFSVHAVDDGDGAVALWARNPDGHVAMEAEAKLG